MDDKTFLAKFVADETERTNQRLKEMVARETPPTEEEKAELVKDLEASMSRLMQSLDQLQAMIDADDELFNEDTTESEKLPI